MYGTDAWDVVGVQVRLPVSGDRGAGAGGVAGQSTPATTWVVGTWVERDDGGGSGGGGGAVDGGRVGGAGDRRAVAGDTTDGAPDPGAVAGCGVNRATVHQIHVYADDSTKDHRGRGRCGLCGLPESNRLHRVPERSEEQRRHEKRYDTTGSAA